ncbi:MAG: 30S ribosomal protein S2 [Puniceicoccales bacterium]|jgi:small subunit ribosomal protein S2|nr:30S ribosomal protein S2 [Puniceicoccales bacterium]
MDQITAQELFQAGVHVGHQIKRWNPKSKPYVYDNRYGISIINLEKTLSQLKKASQFIENLVAGGKTIWFVGTKQQVREVIREVARNVRMPYCALRWLGGTLTNFSTINRSLQKYKRLLRMEEKGEIDQMHNKEASALRRNMVRMQRNFEGLLDINGVPGALFVVDIKNEIIAVNEARKLSIPVIAIADSNADPSLAQIPIPGNDDSVRSIQILMKVIEAAVFRGLEKRSLRQTQKNSAPINPESIGIDPEVRLTSPDGGEVPTQAPGFEIRNDEGKIPSID